MFLYLVMGMNFYSKKMFPLKFHKHREFFYEMKEKEGQNSNGFNGHFNLRLLHHFPYIHCLSYQNIVLFSPSGLQ